MKCKKCGKTLSGKQKNWCSSNCSKLGLKALYRKKNKDKVNEYNRNYRGSCNRRPLSKKRKTRFLDSRGHKCENCDSKKDLHIHHIRPLISKGTHNYNNLMVLCEKCHKIWEIRMQGFWK